MAPGGTLMNGIEPVADVVTGGMLGRAAEPSAGEGMEGHTGETVCLNCGTPLIGSHCHQCGQRAHVHRTITAFFHDLLHGVFHFEGKIWRTLPMLAWRPGELTRRYIDGQRASYVSPIALFLFSVFLMFAVVSATGNLNPDMGGAPNDLAQAETESVKALEGLRTAREAALKAGDPTARIDEEIKEQQATLDIVRTMRSKGVTEAVLESPKATFHSSIPWIEQAYLKAKKNPQLLIYKLKTNSYKWSWALIPLSVPFVWLLFPFSRRFRVYDHVVFVTYSLCFVSLLVILASVLAYAGVTGLVPFLLLLPPVHLFRQLKGTYQLDRWGALWRTAMLLIAAVFVLSFFALLIIALGALD
jgi:hypothetical protein